MGGFNLGDKYSSSSCLYPFLPFIPFLLARKHIHLPSINTAARPVIYSSISLSASVPAPKIPPPGIRPSFSSFSSLAISCKLFAFRIRTSTRFLSLGVSLIRNVLSVETVPLGFEEGMSNVRDLIPMICARKEEGFSRNGPNGRVIGGRVYC